MTLTITNITKSHGTKLIYISLVIMMLLCSCGSTHTEYVNLFDTFLFIEMELDVSFTPALFNPANGTVMPLCTDPICDHTEQAGCPFAGYTQIFTVEDGKLYYSVNVSEKKSDGNYLGTAYRVYDIETGSVKELCRKTELHRTEGSTSSIGSIAGDWQYISQSGDTNYYYRVNFKTGEIEDLSYLDEVFLPIYEDASYLYVPLTPDDGSDARTGIVRMNHKFEKQELLFDTGELLGNMDFSMAEDGGIYYFTQNPDSCNLYRYSIKKNKTELILENILYAVIGEDAIYYTKAAENPEYLYYDEWRRQDMYDTIDGKIYVCDPDGKNSKLIYDTEQYIVRKMDMQYKNGYLICDFGKIVEKEYKNGEMKPWLEANGGGKIVIDTKTGEATAYEKTW